MQALSQRPLLLFLVVGALLFAADAWRRSEVIVLDDAVAQRVAGLWETQMGTPPDPETLESLLSAWLREEVFFREALRRGLDEDDTVLRRRLVQKLEFLVQDMTPGAVSDAALEGYFAKHRDRYRLPERFTFEQRLYPTRQAAEAALARIQAGGAPPIGLQDLPQSYVGKSEAELQQALGSAFASALARLPLRTWTGPVTSTFGSHLVRIETRLPPEVPPLAFVAPRVRTDYLRAQREASLDRFFAEVRGRYRVEDRR
ncbi:MAG: hypothetical protein RLZZ174_1526 [Pseudomonadota bacterium]|jgi:peptidyl-prolyl cis-trans isomerase C